MMRMSKVDINWEIFQGDVWAIDLKILSIMKRYLDLLYHVISTGDFERSNSMKKGNSS